jgi:hypothetical protein
VFFRKTSFFRIDLDLSISARSLGAANRGIISFQADFSGRIDPEISVLNLRISSDCGLAGSHTNMDFL